MTKNVKKVFTKGVGNADFYRIPSIICTNNNVLIAVADERFYSNADNPNKINKVMRRSFDGGETWEPLKTIVEESGDTQATSSAAIDPCLLYNDLTNTIYLLYSHTPPGIGLYNSERSIGGFIKGKEIPTSYLMLTYSNNEGLNWSKPLCLNNMVKDPKWGFIGPGPGIGICMKSQKYRGRLVFPIYYGGNKLQPSLMSCVIYSDDLGITWQRGEATINYNEMVDDGVFASEEMQLTESQIIEQEDGKLLAFIRNHNKIRKVMTATSIDGGETWQNHQFLDDFNQPICQVSALKFYYQGKSCVAVVHPNNQKERIDGTIRLSEDDGKSFPYQRIIKKGQFIYNSITYLSSGEIGVLYEPDWQSIDYMKLTIKWIKGE